MRLTRVLIDAPLTPGSLIDLPESAARHLTTVLRLRAGARFIAFDGHSDHEASAVLETVGKKGATARILEVASVTRESPLDLTLVQAISGSEKMDYALQKAVELGVKRIVPVWSERSQRRLKGPQVEKKLRHWQGVISHATEQSGRTRLATLAAPQPLGDYIASREREREGIVLDPTAANGLASLAKPEHGLDIHIGPEGGFSADELQMLDHAGIRRLRMGPRILRTETAGVAVLAWLQTQFGDCGN